MSKSWFYLFLRQLGGNTQAQLIVLSGLSFNRVVRSFDLTSLVIKWISTGFHSFYCRDFDQDNTAEGQTSVRWKHLTPQIAKTSPRNVPEILESCKTPAQRS
jgi:hypothetical protein